MNKSLRLSIPTPCAEDWEKMMSAEQGRHCEQCCKTVVDFTGMSDEEVLNYFKKGPAGGTCGRFASDQLGRELAPAPVQRNGWKGWQLVLASALVMGKGTGPARPLKAGMEVRQVGPRAQHSVEMGETLMRLDTSRLTLMGDTTVSCDRSSATMGMPKMMVGDIVEELPAVTVTAQPQVKPKVEAFTGLVTIVRDTAKKGWDFLDTVRGVKVVVDSVVDFWKDTVAGVAPGMSGARAFGDDEMVRIYPNPVARGGMMRIRWAGEVGRYQVALVSARGVVVQERVIDIGGKGQVSEWVLPNGLAAGVYFLRVSERGEMGRSGAMVWTREVVVQ